MSATVEAARLLQLLAAPATPGESVKSAIRRAARRAGMPAGLAKRLWYGEARRIDADTMDLLRDRAAARLEQEDAIDARRSLLARIAACEAALGLPDADAARALDHAACRAGGGVDRALDRG
jgi:hypothetical protein